MPQATLFVVHISSQKFQIESNTSKYMHGSFCVIITKILFIITRYL